MARFYLYRILVTESPQKQLFTHRSRRELLYAAFHEKPSVPTRGTVKWHLGNVEDIEQIALYFRIGKIGRTIEPRFDEGTADFIDTEAENAPYTHGFVDFENQVCVIATNTKLAPTAKSIAARLQQLLRSARAVGEQRAIVEVAEIFDPGSFLAEVNAAYAVLKFTVGFGLPNPFDANEDFQKPMQKYLASLEGNSGSTTVRGKGDLNREVIADMARAAAASGKTASATVKSSSGARPEVKRIEGTPASFEIDEIPEGSERRDFIRRIIAAYISIRDRDKSL